jgi:hypothetical protein
MACITHNFATAALPKPQISNEHDFITGQFGLREEIAVVEGLLRPAMSLSAKVHRVGWANLAPHLLHAWTTSKTPCSKSQVVQISLPARKTWERERRVGNAMRLFACYFRGVHPILYFNQQESLDAGEAFICEGDARRDGGENGGKKEEI